MFKVIDVVITKKKPVIFIPADDIPEKNN